MASAARHAALVERLQVEARQAPRRYRFKLALLALAGYGVLLAVLVVALGVPLALLVAMLVSGRTDPHLAWPILLFGGFGVLMLRALWIRFDAPQGYRLRPGDAPLLEAEVERLRGLAGASPLDGIIIDGELNAAAAQVPRSLGLRGHRQYLVLGLPLMQLFDREELASVIAHEFGHFGERDGHFTGWIYRVRLSWYRVLTGLAQSGSITARLLFKFFEWYVPYFDAYSFVLARAKEYQADAAAARAVGAEAAGSALVRMELTERRLQRGFWPQLFAHAAVQKHPPLQLHGELARALRQPAPADLSRLAVAVKPEADLEDTHPSLPQRLAALGVDMRLRERAGQSAAEAWLGALLPQIEHALDQRWRNEAEARWLADYQAAATDRARLAEIEGRAERSPAELLEYAQLIEKLRPGFDAGRLYEQAIAASPDSAMAHYRAGLLQLRGGDWDGGSARLRRAMQLDPGAIRPVVTELAGFLTDPTVEATAATRLQALHDELAPLARAQEVRDGVAGEDDLIAHGLDAAAMHGLRVVLARQERVAQAWLARKRIEMAEDAPHYVLLVDWRGSVVSEAAGLKRLSDALRLPGSHSVLAGSDRRELARKVRQSCDDPVYRRGR